MNVTEITTEEAINSFCDSLKESMLRHVREKSPVCIEKKHDHESVGNQLEPIGYRWMGGTLSVHFGRSASTVLLREQR